MRIIKEYMRKLSLSGRPGVGDAFMKWVFYNQWNQEACKLIHLIPKQDDPDDFEEFPADSRLNKFDRSDRKFVAVALASQLDPEILNATDRDWWEFKEAFEVHGLKINFLCPGLMSDP